MNEESAKECLICANELQLFSMLNAEELKFLSLNRTEVSYQPGETIIKTGSPLTHVLCLTSGMVKIYLEESGQKKILLGITKPVTMIRGPGFLVDYINHFTITSIEYSSACFYEVHAIEKIMQSNPAFSMAIVSDINLLILKYYDRILSLTHNHVAGKMANAMLYLTESVYGSEIFKTYLTRQNIADLAGMTKESAIRVLKDFKDEGILRYSNRTGFEILDKEALIRISRTG